jgi:hypothetical protein
MSDPFAAALATLHASVLGMDAIYTPSGGEPKPIRVIRSQGSEYGEMTIMDRDQVSIQRVDVALPQSGAALQLLGSVAVAGILYTDPVLRINGDPMLDVEGLSWACAIVLV